MSLRDAHESSENKKERKFEFFEGEEITEVDVDRGEIKNAFDEFYRLSGLDRDDWALDRGSLTVKLWQQSKLNEDGNPVPVWLRSYGGKVLRSSRPELSQKDIESLLSIGNKYPRIRSKKVEEKTRVFVISDLQVGKVDRLGGTPELIERVKGMIETMREISLADPCSRAVIIDPGDLVEGFENVSSQSFTNDLSLPEMLRVARGILTDIVTAVSSVHQETVVATCPSNHGAWRRGKGNLGRPGDDFGIDVHLSVKETLERDPRYQSIEWKIPESLWDEITYLSERGHDLAVTHGHHARNGKFGDFWRKQAGTLSQAHNVDIVYSGHYHYFVAQALGINAKGVERLHLQSPAMDNGSSWWQNISGDHSKPGIVTHLIDENGWSDIRLITSDK